MMTNTSVIGFVGGEEYPNVVNIFEGYKQGAEWVNDNITVIGTYLNDWDNPAGEERLLHRSSCRALTLCSMWQTPPAKG
jgi:basic membrane lipoprotein Med (substrate-binding protein (PBP1-ABC) superfamily)